MKKQRLFLSILTVIVITSLFSCAPAGSTDKTYGFLYGVLHGFLCIFAVIGKMFSMDVGLYAVNNTGFFYWLGYLFGLMVIGGGGAASGRR